ncbi:MAG: AAA family ATPase [Chloroflexi bacterium]|nr:AAA family ATPase [Chloroflexota bacterium]MCI0578666.1 AAA family ATPase [Chloroflexota bacterium]MCI0647239.1 AAA family ATPase [Chloroflexota bacterium]MCI0728965.1 AAA family ATPase [Chloroflexota bacterium]
MGSLKPEIPSAELSRLMTAAAGRMKEYKLKLLTPQLLLRAFLDDTESAAYHILQQLAKQRGFDWHDFSRRVEMMAGHTPGQDAHFTFTDDFGQNVALAEEMLVVLDEGLTIAQAREEMKVHSGHALAAMAQPNVTTYGLLQRLGVTAAAVTALLSDVAESSQLLIHDVIQEAKDGQAQPVYQREELLRELLQLLALAQRRHVIFVGPEGAGKRTLGYSLAQLLAEGKGPALRSFVVLNETALLENALVAMRAGLRRANSGILFVPSIERFFGDRLRAQFPEQVNRELHKALLGEEQVIIGTATPAAYELLSKERLIRQQTHRLDVPPATKEETVAILGFHKQRLEREYEINVAAEALQTAATLAGQYIKTIALPAAAVQLVDRACAMVRVADQGHVTDLPRLESDQRLDSEDIMAAASQMTRIPISKLSQDEKGRYANMVEHLHERIIGQEEAIMAVSRAVKTARVGLRDPKRPIGSFLFLGPSGVGKSELAKALAEFMFGSEEAMLTLDMSEYQEEASVNRLIGAPPGYVGFEGGGQLTDFVREKPYTVVLFDEVEKAHPRVLDVLLQVMEEGRLTDGQGRLTTFSETVIIMTSNLGAHHMLTPVIGEQQRELVMAEVRHFFRPEFLNRLDDIILFHQLTPEQLADILELMLKKEIKLAGQQGMQLTVTPEAKKWLLAQNDQPEFGARPLRRIIARHLREPLADFLLGQGARPQAQIAIDAGPAGLHFQADERK